MFLFFTGARGLLCLENGGRLFENFHAKPPPRVDHGRPLGCLWLVSQVMVASLVFLVFLIQIADKNNISSPFKTTYQALAKLVTFQIVET